VRTKVLPLPGGVGDASTRRELPVTFN